MADRHSSPLFQSDRRSFDAANSKSSLPARCRYPHPSSPAVQVSAHGAWQGSLLLYEYAENPIRHHLSSSQSLLMNSQAHLTPIQLFQASFDGFVLQGYESYDPGSLHTE